MKNRLKQKQPFILAIFASLSLLLFFAYIGFEEKSIITSNASPTSKMQYVLVNEDRGADFEGQQYLLGTDFVTLINKDTTNRWETTTRNIATAGLENGQFDAKIIIPQDFSERLLSLQSINPEKAIIEYQVRDGQNEITNQMIEEQVNQILTNFNQRVVQMYFSSIVGNLSEAQQNVNKMTNTHSSYQQNLENTIYQPFKNIPDNYASVLDTTSILEKTNSTFNAQQQAFVDSVQTLLDRNNTSLEETHQETESVQETIVDYTKEANEKINEAIEQFNQQVDVQKNQLAAQWENATIDYTNQHDLFNDAILTQFSNFYTSNEQNSMGVYWDFLTQATAFQTNQQARIEEIQQQITELESQVEQLERLKGQIANAYYNDPTSTPETATEDQVKHAIIKLMTNQRNEPKLDGAYQSVIEQALPQIPTDSLAQLLAELQNQAVISQDQAAIFNDELTIVTRYANDFDQPIGSEASFAYLEPRAQHEANISLPTAYQQISIDLNQETVLSIQTEEQYGAVTFDPTHDFTEMENDLNQLLAPYNYETAIRIDTDHSLTILKPWVIEPEEETEEGDHRLENPSLPETLAFEIKIPLSWQLTPEQQTTSYNQVFYTWMINERVQQTNEYSVYLPMDQPLIDDVPQILELFQLLSTTAQQIVTLFGAPHHSITTPAYRLMIDQPENIGKSLIELADSRSIYWLYNNLQESDKPLMISEQLYQEYKKTGDQLYGDTENQLIALQAVIGSPGTRESEEQKPTLYGTLHLMTLPQTFVEEADKLNQWFASANQHIHTVYTGWQQTAQIEAESVITEGNPHPKENEYAMIEARTTNLIETMQGLMASSKSAAEVTGQSAAEVADIAPTIEQLKESTVEVQDNANTILSNLSSSLDESAQTISENQLYAEAFSGVLSNTRNGGADNPHVFNFLASPILGQVSFGQTRQSSLTPYYVTLIGGFTILLVSFQLSSVMKKRVVSSADLLVTPNRLWKNIPNMVAILSVTFVLSLIYSILTTTVSGAAHSFIWFIYAFLVFASGQLVLLGFMRQFKKITLYLCGGIFGLFFMLTPLLGVAIKNGSLTEVLYRLSPLQNVQNGFTVLMNEGVIGWGSYLLLILFLLFGIVLNFIVRPEEKKEQASE
ncbi:type VII secretion protein EsaA [Candidatus Enterococcus mangumiae]|uniref:Type VII secretion system accessory factor EsaA n=1 Tax=Candidatus Enterococcus mangumiae TaxID=2230878 RepID=A0ABZ2SZV1_9ENTE|nr:type VII secretion protein EsaA [Enterococcus sp. DIV1094]MBO0488581.1 type VII secretion protein EsaA [Enterococcus sp. DIV1094]